MDPKIHVTAHANLTFTLSAKGGVGAWAWLDHPARTVGYFFDTSSNVPSNGFYLVPGQDRTREYIPCAFRLGLINLLVGFFLSSELSRNQHPDPADFVVRSVWNNTHI